MPPLSGVQLCTTLMTQSCLVSEKGSLSPIVRPHHCVQDRGHPIRNMSGMSS